MYGGRPANRWLEIYAERFDTVEVNSTFYRLPTLSAVRGWRDATPPGFVFAVKASRYMTHIKRLAGMGERVGRFMELLDPLADAGKLGPILWQLPPAFRRDDARLAEALEGLPDGLHCFEFRHPSWFCAEVLAMLRERGVGLVVGVHPQRPRDDSSRVTDWTYVRFHYGSRGRAGNFSDTEIGEWAAWVEERSGGGQVYAYFDNDWNALAVRNADVLRKYLGLARPARAAW